MKTPLGTLKHARHMRRNMTEEETILWSDLRELRQRGMVFRRQVPLGIFIVDFLCRKAKLVIEVDGNHHGDNDVQWKHDQERDEWLRSNGYTILRFWNSDVRQGLESVVERIYETASALTTQNMEVVTISPSVFATLDTSPNGGGKE